jgi:16S rRNA (cytosine1402-N4)-methyltransferase
LPENKTEVRKMGSEKFLFLFFCLHLFAKAFSSALFRALVAAGRAGSLRLCIEILPQSDLGRFQSDLDPTLIGPESNLNPTYWRFFFMKHKNHVEFHAARGQAGGMENESTAFPPAPGPHQRRARYAGKYPRRFEQKYKEHDPARHAETVAKVLAAGKTPAGMHRPVMVAEVLEALAPQPGQTAVDATLGFGGHARELLARILPGGRLLGLDADPIELPKTEARLRGLGFGAEVFTARRSNFAGLPQALWEAGLAGADMILADLGVSSMQLDDPGRGFSVKHEGPLDLRMNPQRGQPAAVFLERLGPPALQALLEENADETHAAALAPALAGKLFASTNALAKAVRAVLPRLNKEEGERVIRRVFQTLRIAVNDEFSALETFLRTLPECLQPGGRATLLTFHSGEDRRVKKYFEAGRRDGVYAEISGPLRPGAGERRANPRSAPAKLRWARKAM